MERNQLLLFSHFQHSDERRVEHEVTGLEFKSLKQILSGRTQEQEKVESKLDLLTDKVQFHTQIPHF